MSKKDIVLTNWQVPRSPEQQAYDALKQIKPINLDDYKNLGKIDHHRTTESVVEKMVARREAVYSIPNEVEVKTPLNYAGVNDDRGKQGWKIGDDFLSEEDRQAKIKLDEPEQS